MPTSDDYVFIIGAALAVAVVAFTFFIEQNKKQWKKVGKISDLYFHPVKSMRGIQVKMLNCTKTGFYSYNPLLHDRCFLVIHPNGNMITGRTHPKMVTIEVQVNEDGIVLIAPNTSSIQVPIPKDRTKALACKVWGEETFGLDCGDEVANWISDFLDTESRLVYHSTDNNGRDIGARDDNVKDKMSSIGNLLYHDSTPGHLISTASLQDLSKKLKTNVNVRRFRPNIIVSECDKPYEEDNWMHIKIGSAEFLYVRDTYRCVLTTVDPDDGTKSAESEPLKTLRQYRRVKKEYLANFKNNPPFGVSLAVTKEGQIFIDEDVYVC